MHTNGLNGLARVTKSCLAILQSMDRQPGLRTFYINCDRTSRRFFKGPGTDFAIESDTGLISFFDNVGDEVNPPFRVV